MSSPRQIRRCALQGLYVLDAGGDHSLDEILVALAESPGDGMTHREGAELALDAWAQREDADAANETLAVEWPVSRQPVVDRSIVRLAYHEIVSGRTPPKVAINEAVELAKEFSTERSPMFINGVLDKLYRELREAGKIPDQEPAANDV